MSICFLTKTLDAYLGDLRHLEADAQSAQVLLVGGKAIDLDLYPNLRGIFKTGIGTDNLPYAQAKERGIEISLPGSDTCQIIFQETAQFACHMILRCLYRNVGDLETWTKHPRQSLASQRLLVIGTGRIGSIVRDTMCSFCQVTTFDILENSPNELQPLIEAADCISLHIPLIDETQHFFNQTRLSWMRDGASLVNTARGPVVEEEALLEELSNGRLFAALDVFAQEPYSGELARLPGSSVLLTPHVASTCQQFLEGTASDFLTFLQRFGIDPEASRPDA